MAPFAGGTRLWLSRIHGPTPLREFLAAHGHPIRYGYVPRAWPLEHYQTVFATEPGSAEMPSAGRPFTPELITACAARGVLIAPLTLHTGVSSLERGEAPYPERYHVPEETARLVNAVRWWGGRVVAVGTTAVRALETVAADDGTVVAGEGWTRLVVRGLAPAAAGGRRRLGAARGELRRGPGARLSLARVRRQPPRPAVGARLRTSCRRGGCPGRPGRSARGRRA